MLLNRHDKMYAKRSHVHWFVGEGMESGEYSEKRENFNSLIMDYNEVQVEINESSQMGIGDEDSEEY